MEHSQSPKRFARHDHAPSSPSTNTSSISTTISLRDLTTHATLGLDAWSRPSKPQPLLISIYLSLPIQNPLPSSLTDTLDDTLAHSFNYSTLAKDIIARVQDQNFSGLEHLTQQITEVATTWPGQKLRFQVRAPKALVRGDGLERLVWLERVEPRKRPGARGASQPDQIDSKDKGQPWYVVRHEYVVPSLRLACILGLNPHERLEKQDVVFKIRVSMRTFPSSSSKIEGSEEGSGLDVLWQLLVRLLTVVIEATSFQTIEALATFVAEWLLQEESSMEGGKSELGHDSKGVEGQTMTDKVEELRNAGVTKAMEHVFGVGVAVEKPFAVTFAGGAGVEVVREKGGQIITEDD